MKRNRTNRIIQSSVIILGVMMITLGIIQGEADAVMRKAIVVCLECIGIG